MEGSYEKPFSNEGAKGRGCLKNSGSFGSMPTFEDIMKHKNIGSEFVSDMVDKIKNAQQEDRSCGVPSLDLGSQILSAQRKVSGLKRKSPGSAEASPPQRQVEMPKETFYPSPPSPQQLLIADIVSREILSLCSAR